MEAMHRESHVVLDLPSTTLLFLTSFVPITLIALSYLVPFVRSFLPRRIRASRLWNAPFDPELLTSGGVGGGVRTAKVWWLIALAGAEGVAWVGVSLLGALDGEGSWEELTGTAGIAAGWLYASISLLRHPPVTAPYLHFVLYIFYTIATLLALITFVLHPPHASDYIFSAIALGLHLITCIALILITITFPLSPPSPAKAAEVTDEGKESPLLESPEGSVSLGAWITFSWVGSLIRQGGVKKLETADIWELSGTMKAEEVRRSARQLSSKRLIPRVFFNNSLDITLSLTLGLTSSFLSYCSPYFLKKILEALSSPLSGKGSHPELRQSAYIYAGLALLAQVIRAEVDLQQLWHERRLIVRARSQLTGEVYEKALKRLDLSGVVAPKEDETVAKGKKKTEAPSATSTGKIVSLMTADTTRVANQLMGLSSIVAAPFELVIAITFLYSILGWTCLAGLSVMAISLPLNHILVRRRIVIHRSVLSSRDKRMEILNEFIQAIRFVKYSASENQWLGRVFKARENELGWLLKTRLNNLMISVIWNFTPDLVMLISLACYTKILGKELTVPVAFTALALFALVRAPMSMLPASVTQLLQTYIAIQRLEAFFDEPEVESWVSSLREEGEETSQPGSITIVDGSFRYQDTSTKVVLGAATVEAPVTIVKNGDPVVEEEAKFELKDINVNFPIGALSLVCGPTGSGKSSLFLALLGEINRTRGTVNLPKSDIVDDTGLYDGVAYTAQIPWLEHASIRNNILFGAVYEEDRYRNVIEACALLVDLEMFEAGDETEIGEKGISLSGGQKARVALARAVYSRAKTVLLDDPLSAIDMNTARHIYQKCLKGPLMEHRTIILITHHVSLCLSGAEYIVRMSSGTIVLQGPVSELDKTQIVTEALNDDKLVVAEEVQVDLADTKLEPSSVLDSLAPTRVSSPVAPVKIKSAVGKLVEEEARATGRVKGKVYNTYLSAAGWDAWIMIVGLLLIGRALRVVDRYWFKIWGESYRAAELSLSAIFFQSQQASSFAAASTYETDFVDLPHLPSASDNVNPYLLIYGGICVANILIVILGILAGYRGSFRAARSLFTRTLTKVAHAPFRYYDTTPTGRILNRYSIDFGIIDTSLTDQVRTCLTQAFSFIVNVGVIMVVSPSFIAPAVFIIFLYVRLSLSYVRCSRDLRRLESNARSPIYSKFGETLTGIVTVRSFGAERRFLKNLFSSVDSMLAAHYASAMVNRYLLWRFDCLGAIAVAITTFLSLSSNASPGLAALAITSAQSLVSSVYWLCRYVSALEVDLNAVERVAELLELPQEPPMVVEKNRPPAYWPSDTGGVVFDDLVISYAPNLPPVLRNISFEVGPREKVGIVGRTGSGKSTMALSLLRFNEPTSGRILIDGIDISKIGLSDLRSRLTLIPQEAVLFSGTIRSNLDPFNEHTDADCLDALSRVQMISNSIRPSRVPSPVAGGSSTPTTGTTVDEGRDHGRLSVGLETSVSAGGLNFSSGQRQLLAMARALLRRSKVIIMDEATASVDFETDAILQHTIKAEFADSLVLTIAHRLRTVIDYDKVLVLDSGSVLEYDTPKNLLTKEGGAFRKMCEQSADWNELKALAGL